MMKVIHFFNIEIGFLFHMSFWVLIIYSESAVKNLNESRYDTEVKITSLNIWIGYLTELLGSISFSSIGHILNILIKTDS